MKTTSIKNKKSRQRIRTLLSAVLAVMLLLATVTGSITASAVSEAQYNANAFAKRVQPKIDYKIVVTTESQASGWNSASLKAEYSDGAGTKGNESWDIESDISNGKTITKTFSLPKDDIPYNINLYLDFGGGFTVRSHSGRIKFYAQGEELFNEPYSARSYPFSSSKDSLDFDIHGICPTIVISPNGNEDVYMSVKKAWSAAKDINGATVMLWENCRVSGTLEVNKRVTLDLNGYLFGNSDEGRVFDIKKGAELSIIDSNPARDTGETFTASVGATSAEDMAARTYKLKGGGIYHATSEEKGGAIIVEKGGALNVTGCTFCDCHSAEDYGGAIQCEGKLNLKGTKFIFCTAFERYGGAINLTGEHEASLENLTFERCAARDGGAVSFTNDDDDGVLTKFENCTFNFCRADAHGGALYHGGNTEITANKLTFNKCSAQYGGGVYYATGWSAFDITVSPITITNSKFENCSAETGGAIEFFKAHDMTIDNVEIKNCKSSDDGGAIYIRSITEKKEKDKDFAQYEFRIRNSEIYNCAAEDDGGAIYTWNENGDTCSRLVVYNCSIHDNTAKRGGAFYVESPFVYLVNSNITKNKATGKYGGGIYVDSMFDIELSDEIVIRDNTANGKTNNLCLQNGVFSSAKIYCGGIYDGSYIGVSSTSSGTSTVAMNVSQFQMSKFIKPDNSDYGLSMKNIKEVETKLYASMLSQNASIAIIVAGFAVIICAVAVLYLRKRKKEGKSNDANS